MFAVLMWFYNLRIASYELPGPTDKEKPGDGGRGGGEVRAPPVGSLVPKWSPFQILHVPTFKKPCHYFQL